MNQNEAMTFMLGLFTGAVCASAIWAAAWNRAMTALNKMLERINESRTP